MVLYSVGNNRKVKVMKICKVDGCSKPYDSHGYCGMHNMRMKRHGMANPPMRRENGTGSVNVHGYHVITVKGHPIANSQGKAYAHRVILYDAIGEGPHACHWCKKSLQWYALIPGHQPSDALIADHVDGNRLNNELSNLVPSCQHCNNNRLTERYKARQELAAQAQEMRANGMTYKAIAERLNLSGTSHAHQLANVGRKSTKK